MSELTNRRGIAIAAGILVCAWLLAYGPTVPGGFIKDDFGWVYHGRINGWSSVYSTFATTEGFYRPLVRLSFGATDALFGINPIPYALTNLLLGLACAGLVYRLGRSLGLPRWSALVAAAVWAFNFHGINMSVVWLSGRTSLFGTLFSLLAAIAVVRGRGAWAAAFAFAALLSKEEVLALPLILTAWLIIDRASVKTSLGTWAALAVYLALREHSGAFGIGDAPPYYRFVSDPLHVLRNVVEYADRSSTFCALVVLAACLAARRLPALQSDDRRILWKAGVWLVAGFALTVWLPVRSSLYAVFPSVGAALAAGVAVTALARSADPLRTVRLATAALALPFVLLPVYWQRNVRWTELRDLSNRTLRAIEAAALPSRTLVVLEDDLSTRANFRHAFGVLFPEAAALHFGDDVSLWIEPPPPEVDSSARPTDVARVVSFRLVGGRVEAAGRLAINRAP